MRSVGMVILPRYLFPTANSRTLSMRASDTYSRVAFAKLYTQEPSHSGRYCYGKMPMERSMIRWSLAKDKILNRTQLTNV